MKPRGVVSFGFVLFVVACGGGSGGGGNGGGGADPQAGPGPTATAALTHGHFVGEVTAGNKTLLVESLVTIDGQVRMHVSSTWWNRASVQSGSGPSLPLAPLDESMQVVGQVDLVGRRASGSGVV